jgi:hypothetical protein
MAGLFPAVSVCWEVSSKLVLSLNFIKDAKDVFPIAARASSSAP